MNDCEPLHPLLFASLEDALAPDERRRLERHLAGCAACRAELERERALTRALRRSPRRRRVLASTFGAAAACLAAVLLLVPAREADGSILPLLLSPEMVLRDGERRPLEDANHIEVKTGDSCRIEIEGVGTLRADGPAMFELDRDKKGWKLVLLKGDVRATLRAPLVVVTTAGARTLGRGEHAVAAGGAVPGRAPFPFDDGSGFWRRASWHSSRYGLADPATEKRYRDARDAPGATPEQKARAHFYLCASLGRQGKFAEAVREQADWLERYPDDQSRHHVFLFQGIYLRKLGREKEARACLETVLRLAPGSDHARIARGELGAEESAAPRAKERGGEARAAPRGKGYVVVPVAPVDRRFAAVARKAAAFHGGAVVAFDGRDFDGLARALRAAAPRNVLFVVAPEVLDVNLHRRLLLLSARIDADPLVDFAFGYLTARDGAALERFWARTEALHQNGLGSRTWLGTSVASNITCTVYPGSVPDIARAAGFSGQHVYYGTVENDPDNLRFVDRTLPDLERAAVLTMSGCGDPQGTWLFNDRRNAERDKHWDYDPARVGHDPEGEMPRLTADRIARLELKSPVCWSGVCHQGATRRVFVEGDIVSTFGRTTRATVYELAGQESFCLAMLDAGAGAYLCSIAANHGYAVLREIDFALTHGASLGEVMKSTYDDVLLAGGDGFRLDLQVEGAPVRNTEEVMQGGGANRLLIGDPALRLFDPTPHPLETVTVTERTARGFVVTVERRAGFVASAWDMYGGRRGADWRIGARVPLDRTEDYDATVAVSDAAGRTLSVSMTHAVVETFHGRSYLHLQANGPREGADRQQVRAVFRVRVR